MCLRHMEINTDSRHFITYISSWFLSADDVVALWGGGGFLCPWGSGQTAVENQHVFKQVELRESLDLRMKKKKSKYSLKMLSVILGWLVTEIVMRARHLAISKWLALRWDALSVLSLSHDLWLFFKNFHVPWKKKLTKTDGSDTQSCKCCVPHAQLCRVVALQPVWLSCGLSLSPVLTLVPLLGWHQLLIAEEVVKTLSRLTL